MLTQLAPDPNPAPPAGMQVCLVRYADGSVRAYGYEPVTS